MPAREVLLFGAGPSLRAPHVAKEAACDSDASCGGASPSGDRALSFRTTLASDPTPRYAFPRLAPPSSHRLLPDTAPRIQCAGSLVYLFRLKYRRLIAATCRCDGCQRPSAPKRSRLATNVASCEVNLPARAAVPRSRSIARAIGVRDGCRRARCTRWAVMAHRRALLHGRRVEHTF